MTNQRKDMDGAAPDRLAVNVLIHRNRLNKRSGAPCWDSMARFKSFVAISLIRPNSITVHAASID